MVSIGRLKIRNFKSFKFIDIPLSSNFIALAGPNGSGKSNFTDGIRFALGETSLRSLRAKKVKDLIFVGSESGEVTLYFDGHEKYEVHRAIRKDGKIRYRLNGKKTTRQSILDALRQYNLDQSGRNIIAQGSVQNIVHMSGKERRAILDSVAGISDFEEKKKEALRELDLVSNRIKDANLVMGERLAYLKELEQEREKALQYRDARGQAEQARASLLHLQIQGHEDQMERVVSDFEKIQRAVHTREEEFAALEKEIAAVETQRSALSSELQTQQQTAGLIQTIETLKASMGSKTQAVEDAHALTAKLTQESTAMQKEFTQETHEVKRLENERAATEKQLRQLEARHGNTAEGTSSLAGEEAQLEKLYSELQRLREAGIASDAALVSKRELLSLKENELQELEVDSARPSSSNAASERVLHQRIAQTEKQLDASFDRMKACNQELAEQDRQLLAQKEQASMLRMRVSPSMGNAAFRYLEQRKNQKGIHGMVASLIQFDSAYGAAVEAAAGGRLLYMVVEDSDLAMQLIKELKSRSEGRVTFVPLHDIRSVRTETRNGCKPLSEYLRFDAKLKPAMDFVFGSTLLTKDMAEAKKLRGARVVTLDGEIFEPSGIITGGKVKTSVLAASQLAALEKTISDIQGKKNGLLAELEQLRENESVFRSQKAEAEVQLKTLELQAAQRRAEEEKMQKTHLKQQELTKEIEKLRALLQSKLQEKERLEHDCAAAQERLEKHRQALAEFRQRAEVQRDAEQRKREEWVGKLSHLRASLHGADNELQLRKQAMHNKQERNKELQKEIRILQNKIKILQQDIARQSAELKEAEDTVQKKSKQMEKLFTHMKALETQLQGWGEKRGQKKLELDRWAKDQNELEVRRATLQTRLEDLRKEYGPHQAVEKLSLPKEKLSSLLEEAERTLQHLGDVNMAAIEMYLKKKEELGGIEEKLGKLGAEREAILRMMDELEIHKKQAFFETYEGVAEHFQSMFRHLNIGQGFLYLDKPNEPFESGLHIKLRRGNKEHVLDSLSGGENSLIALMFIFALQFFKPSPFYILDEVDAALDKENSKNLAQLISGMAKETQFLVVTHNDTVIGRADAVLGVTKVDGTSKLVGVKLEQKNP